MESDKLTQTESSLWNAEDSLGVNKAPHATDSGFQGAFRKCGHLFLVELLGTLPDRVRVSVFKSLQMRQEVIAESFARLPRHECRQMIDGDYAQWRI